MKRELTNEQLLDRYIHSLTLALPTAQAGDIAAEIRSNLQSLVDDKAAQLGRQLSLQELSAILKKNGHPVLVATRYHEKPRRALVGPELFPFYSFTLRALLATIFTILVIIGAFKVQGQRDPAALLLHYGRDIVLALFSIGAIVTVLFALWEYLEFRYRFSEKWKPESLPAVPPPIRQPKQPRPVVQIATGVVWVGFWAATWYLPGFSWVWGTWAWGGAGVFSLSATADAMRLPLFLLAVVGVSLTWLDHTRFAAAEWRGYLRIALSLSVIVINVFLLSHGDFLVAGARWDPAQAETLATLNHMIGGTLVLGCILSGLVCVRDLRCLVQGVGFNRRVAGSPSRS